MVSPLQHNPSAEAAAPRLRIVVGENNEDLATTLSLLLDAEPDMTCIARATSSDAVLRRASELLPDAFVLDLSLDDGPSLPLISRLRTQLPEAAIVVYTGHSNNVLSETCLSAGANAVIVKSGDIEPLTEALRRTARGRPNGASSNATG
jgi:DNA-binding NarL/FixJ family response regulator